MIGREQVVRCLVTTGTNQLLFVLPPQARTTGTSSDTIVLWASDGRSYFNLRILEPLATGPEQKPPSPSDRAAARFPGVHDLQEFSMSVAGQAGQGVEFQREFPEVGKRFFRILWVPSAAGTLEFFLDADVRNAAAGRQLLESVLVTVQSNNRGPIRVVPRSDKS